MGKKVIMTARRHNFGLIRFDVDWSQTDYVLLEDSRLIITIYKGRDINMYGTRIRQEDAEFINANLDDYIERSLKAPKQLFSAGDAWMFQTGNKRSDLKYIHGLDLEIIGDILYEASEPFEKRL